MLKSQALTRTSFRPLNEDELLAVSGGWGNPTIWDNPIPDVFELPDDPLAGPFGGISFEGIFEPGNQPGGGTYTFSVQTSEGSMFFKYKMEDNKFTEVGVKLGDVTGIVDLESGALTGKFKLNILGGGQAELEVRHGPIDIPGPGNNGISGTSAGVTFTWRI